MEIKASLNNLRMASRKVRLVTNLIKGMSVPQAKGRSVSVFGEKTGTFDFKIVKFSRGQRQAQFQY
ncbi:MAG: hypothetical protein LiPW39_457 [Parcubacteria group bacterium LiPW_39]|nr:MAG: hypothetical protein LiPW39_457 [Parcubacteria group bacterium LiPW_39]